MSDSTKKRRMTSKLAKARKVASPHHVAELKVDHAAALKVAEVVNDQGKALVAARAVNVDEAAVDLYYNSKYDRLNLINNDILSSQS